VSIIEQAARRLEELRRAGIAEQPPAPALAPGTGVTPSSPGAPRGAEAPAAPVPPPASPARRSEDPGARKWLEGRNKVELDLGALARKGFVAPGAPRSRLADEFRGAKHGLLQNVRGGSAGSVARANCIMVTSALPGEGKTFTAINLALSLAREIDLSVLLVDADVMRPALPERLGLPSSQGLLDLLSEPGLSLPDVVLRTNVDKLQILPSGSARGHATELLASDGMKRLVAEMSAGGAGRIVLFDAPPLLAVPEARALAMNMGQIVLVVEAQRTPRHAVLEALETIKECPVVLTLLNKLRGRAAPPYGYGASGYGPQQPEGPAAA
jgi:exopolysaccharide/PEP-CTERM locus tyrosine autokinase